MGSEPPLNEAQKRAALHAEGPLLIIAGAGAGKTHTIAYRILTLVRKGTPPESILAITFTNKAAGELRERIRRLLAAEGVVGGIPTAATFHALGAEILRVEHDRDGLPRFFNIADRQESLSFVKRAMESKNLDPKSLEPKKLLAAISRNKNKLVSWDTFAETAEGYFGEAVRDVWQGYERLMRRDGALDFDDLILRPVRLLAEYTDVREKYQRKWRYLHIDEYQDTSASQDRFAHLLTGPEQNICVIGDGDQSIYGWRDADPQNILRFPDRHPGTTVIVLEENYRSTKHILDAANDIIQKNRHRHEKNLFTRREGGEKITVFEAMTETDEAAYVTEMATELIDAGTKPQDIAVLFRANFQSRTLEEAFLHSGIPYQLVGTRFYERKEVKDTLAYLRYALNPADTESLRRAIGAPRRGIGPASIEKIAAGKSSEIPKRAREAFARFEELVRGIREAASSTTPSELLARIIKDSGMETMYAEEPDGEERVENMRELVSLATRYDTVPKPDGAARLLSDMSLISEQDTLGEARTGVRLMTVHAAKGLEFEAVFVTGLEQDLFPHRRNDADEERGEIGGEEERRLFYVAVTRAKRRLFLTYALYRTIFGHRTPNIPSVFLQDLRPELIEFHSGLGDTPRFDTGDGEDVIQWDCLKR